MILNIVTLLALVFGCGGYCNTTSTTITGKPTTTTTIKPTTTTVSSTTTTLGTTTTTCPFECEAMGEEPTTTPTIATPTTITKRLEQVGHPMKMTG